MTHAPNIDSGAGFRSGTALRRLGGGLVAVGLLLAGGSAGLASPGSFTEDFTSDTYKDPDQTTAWWNTAAGELTLFPLPRVVGSLDTPGTAERASWTATTRTWPTGSRSR